jgi:hypothetical protein
MLKTNRLVKTETITFRDVPVIPEDYRGKSFKKIKVLQGDIMVDGFINWVNGGLTAINTINGYQGNVITNEPAWDVSFFGRDFTADLREYVQNKILQKLNIHRGELDYKFESTLEVGVPYLDKLTEEELNFFIREAIMEVIGAKEITKFKSEIVLDKERAGKSNYIVKFEVITERGDLIWQSIEI